MPVWLPTWNRGVAQPGSALHWGCSGRRFKSCRPDQLNKKGHLQSRWPFLFNRRNGMIWGSKRQVHKLRLRRNLNESQRDAAPTGLVTNFSLLLIKSCRPLSVLHPVLKCTNPPKRSLDYARDDKLVLSRLEITTQKAPLTVNQSFSVSLLLNESSPAS